MLILTYLFALLGIALAVLAQVGYTSREREGSPILHWLQKRKTHLFVASIAVCGIAIGTVISQHIPDAKPVLELSQGPGGQLIQKATSVGFTKETDGAGGGRLSEAKDYFGAGERAFAETRYRDAARNYQRSIDLLPTMPGYLNLGIALLHASDAAHARKVLFDGVEIARRKRDRAFDAAFIGAIAMVFAIQGDLWNAFDVHHVALRIARGICDPLGEGTALAGAGWVSHKRRNLPEALESYEQALKVFEKNRIRLGQAMTLLATGMVYADQGRLEEAFKAYQGALEVARQAGDPLRQAAALNSIGLVRTSQGKFDEALASYTAALELYKEVGHLLGQADTLSDTGILYAKQGKTREALELLSAARAIYVNAGAGTTRLRVLEEQISRLNAKRDSPR